MNKDLKIILLCIGIIVILFAITAFTDNNFPAAISTIPAYFLGWHISEYQRFIENKKKIQK